MPSAVKFLISAAHVAIFIYGFFLQRNDPELSDINIIGTSIFFSRGAALCLAFDMALIMLLVCRKLLSYIAAFAATILNIGHGTIAEGNRSFLTHHHQFLAYHILFYLVVHVLGHCVNFYRLEQLGRGSAMSYHFGTWAGVTGYWMLLLLGIMFVTAHKKIRKRNYEVFWYSHHLALLVMVFFAFHAYGCFVKTNEGQCRGYNSWKYVVLASLIYILERVLRAIESHQAITLSTAIAHPGGAIELNFKHPTLHYRPGQHLYLNIPQISRFEWHPFTITSSPFEQYISLDIRQDGDWTRQLGRLLGHGPESPRVEQLEVVRERSLLPIIKVDGPYGGPQEDVLNFDHAVFIGTGNGITTFSGILRHIWFRHQETQSSRLKTLDLYWVSRDANKLEWFRSLFSMEKTVELFRTGLIRIHIYFTSSKSMQSHDDDGPHEGSRSRKSLSSRMKTRIQQTFQDTAALNNISPLQTDYGRYSDDDYDDEEEEELLSPLDRLVKSDSLITLQSINHSQTEGSRVDTAGETLELMEQGDGIIGANNIHFGRPDLGLIFEEMKQRVIQSQELSAGSIRVGVFYCGSRSVGRALARESRQSSEAGIKFVFSEV